MSFPGSCESLLTLPLILGPALPRLLMENVRCCAAGPLVDAVGVVVLDLLEFLFTASSLWWWARFWGSMACGRPLPWAVTLGHQEEGEG